MKKKAILAALLIICIAAVVVTEEIRIGNLKERNAALTVSIAQLQAQVDATSAGNTGSGLSVVDESLFASEEAAAEFNGGIVTVGEAAQAYAEIAVYYELAGLDASEYAETAKQEVLAALAEDKILYLKAQEYGVATPSEAQMQEIEAEVQRQYEEDVEYYMTFRSAEGKSEEQVREETVAYLEENGYTYASLLENATQELWRDRLYDAVTANVEMSEDMLRTLYESELETAKMVYTADVSEYEFDSMMGETILYHPAGIRNIQAILIGFSAEQAQRYVELQDALEAGDAAKLSEIEALYQEIVPRAQEVLDQIAQGEDFATLIDAYSDDEELSQEPARSEGVAVAEGSMLYQDAFINGAVALQNIGDTSGMVYVDAGIYILRYVSDVPEGAVAFEDVRDMLAETGMEEIRMAEYNRVVEEWLEEADIKYYADRF